MAKADLSAQRLRELFQYDPGTGVFTRLKTVASRAQAGATAGCVNTYGYLVLSVDYGKYYAHRLAWLYMTGEWPHGVVDHRDTNPANNRWLNLRDVSQGTNTENRRTAIRVKKSGLPMGVYFNKRQNSIWAGIAVKRKMRFLGTFPTADEAHQAYLTAKRVMHEGCTI